MNKTAVIIGIVALAGGVYASRFWDVQEQQSQVEQTQMQPIPVDQARMLKENEILIDDVIITVDVADSSQERMQGLSGRERLQPNTGMLFIFENPLVPSFWMKDMHFSIDIIWIDVGGIIVGFEENAEPSSFPKTFSPPAQVLYVLEAPAGWVSQNKLLVGTLVEGSMIK